MTAPDDEQDYQDGFDRLRVSELRNWRDWNPLRPYILKGWQRIAMLILLPFALLLLALNIAEPKSHGWIVFSIFWTLGIVLALVRDVRARHIPRASRPV